MVENEKKFTLTYQINVPVQLPNFENKTLIYVLILYMSSENYLD